MNKKELGILFRMSYFADVLQYKSGIIECVGTCSVTGKEVIRYAASDMSIYEFNNSLEDWVPLEDGIILKHRQNVHYPYKRENISYISTCPANHAILGI